MEKKLKSCAVLKIDAFVSPLPQNKTLKMTSFEWFFRAVIYNLALPSFRNFPPREKCRKTSTKYFQNSKKIVAIIKNGKLFIQALAA
jgi:hypothetical protein